MCCTLTRVFLCSIAGGGKRHSHCCLCDGSHDPDTVSKDSGYVYRALLFRASRPFALVCSHHVYRLVIGAHDGSLTHAAIHPPQIPTWRSIKEDRETNKLTDKEAGVNLLQLQHSSVLVIASIHQDNLRVQVPHCSLTGHFLGLMPLHRRRPCLPAESQRGRKAPLSPRE